jgi:stress response protein SCP2
MSVNLQKGQRINLEKDGGGDLKQVVVGLGWDAARGGLNIDCDASAFLCKVDGKLAGLNDVVYFGNTSHSSKAVQHTGDNLTGAGEGDDEQIIVKLADIPAQFDKIVFVVNIYKANERKQHFGMIKNAFIRIVDSDTRKELMKYNLSESYDSMTAMIFGEMYRKDGKWKFNAVGQPTQDNSISELAKRYQ